MKKGIFMALLLVLVLIVSSFGFAATTNTVTVTISPFARISVSGSATLTLVESDFDASGSITGKALTSDVLLNVKTNSSTGCAVSASAPDFTSGVNAFSVAKMDASVDGGAYVALSNVSTALFNVATKTNQAFPVAFRLNLDGTETAASNYTTVVTYTVAVNP